MARHQQEQASAPVHAVTEYDKSDLPLPAAWTKVFMYFPQMKKFYPLAVEELVRIVPLVLLLSMCVRQAGRWSWGTG